jgi:hypothetical protein
LTPCDCRLRSLRAAQHTAGFSHRASMRTRSAGRSRLHSLT